MQLSRINTLRDGPSGLLRAKRVFEITEVDPEELAAA